MPSPNPMDTLSREVSTFPATMDDVAKLLQSNSNAAQQLAAITWHRVALELEAQLEQANNGASEEE
jgi:hypothetical protein